MAPEDIEDKMKKRTVTTGCGQGTVFGDLMEEIDSIKLRDDVVLDRGHAVRAARRSAPPRNHLQDRRRGARLRAGDQ